MKVRCFSCKKEIGIDRDMVNEMNYCSNCGKNLTKRCFKAELPDEVNFLEAWKVYNTMAMCD